MPDRTLDSERSSFRESMLEHVFIAELQQEAWFRYQTAIEILRPEVDDAGYDLVAEFKGSVRYIQLKGSRLDGKARSQNVNSGLSKKRGGCVVWLRYKEGERRENRAELQYLFFGNHAKQFLPALEACSRRRVVLGKRSFVLRQAQHERDGTALNRSS